MRPYITVTLILFTFIFASCKKESLADNPAGKLQGTWRLFSTANAKDLAGIDSTRTIRFEGNNMLTFHHDSLLTKESFLMAIKADRQPYLVTNGDPWTASIYSCTLTGNDTLCLFSVHLTSGVRNTYVRVK